MHSPREGAKSSEYLTLHELLVSLMFNANSLLNDRQMKGKDAPENFKGTLQGVRYTLGGQTNVSVTVNNVLIDTKIYNMFGIIKGFMDPGEELERAPACHAHERVGIECELGVCFCRSLRGARRAKRLIRPRIRQVHRGHVAAGGARQGHNRHGER